MNAKIITGLAILSGIIGAVPADGAGEYTGVPHGDSEPLVEQHGIASYYADRFHGQKTANGEIFRQDRLTAASRDLPLGTMVTVTNEENGKSVNVKVNDRGPYVGGRVIDLSKTAAARIGIKEQGIAPVKVEARPSSQPTPELRQVVGAKAAAQQQKALRRASVRSKAQHQGVQAAKARANTAAPLPPSSPSPSLPLRRQLDERHEVNAS
jgi:rare lipoprotein A